MAEDIRPKLEACTVDLHTLLGHVPGYEIEDNKVRRASYYDYSIFLKSRGFGWHAQCTVFFFAP